MTKVFWEVKNFNFKPWGKNISLRCLGGSDLILAPFKVDGNVAPLQVYKIEFAFKQPEDLVYEGKSLIINLSLFDDDTGESFGDDLQIML